jgi:two-component system OmpR family response regulator
MTLTGVEPMFPWTKPTRLEGFETRLITRILLIEDDGETAEEIIAELTDRGFDVEWSPNGIDGLDKARALRPDALIVDRMLPRMDGLNVIETLRKDLVSTPVLVLSALGAVNDRVRRLRMGGDDYLTKPFAIIELVIWLEALLRRRCGRVGSRARSDRAHGKTRRAKDRFTAAGVPPARIYHAA